MFDFKNVLLIYRMQKQPFCQFHSFIFKIKSSHTESQELGVVSVPASN